MYIIKFALIFLLIFLSISISHVGTKSVPNRCRFAIPCFYRHLNGTEKLASKQDESQKICQLWIEMKCEFVCLRVSVFIN